MLTVDTILDLLPWVLIAPAIPLLLVLITRTYNNSSQTSLVHLCVITILSNVFLAVAAKSTQDPALLHISYLATFIFTLLLLKNCTNHRVLKITIFTILLLFIGIYLSVRFMSGDLRIMHILNTIGALVIFLLAVLVLVSLAYKVDLHILANPDFWYSGGVFFHFGLLSLLLFTGKKITDADYHEQNEWSMMYAIVFCLQFLFFSIGVYMHKPWQKKAG
ncbi:MAG: hypothetical protein ACK54A_04870 [Sphingobacteriales bacterium]|jgi:hypothetical protein